MTIDSAPRPAAAGVGLPTWWRRLLDLPLTVHAAGLAVALVLVVAVVGTHDVWNADEGAALAQVDLLADGQGWTADHPLPAVDPDGEFFPLDKAERGDDGGYAPLAKHPLYAVLLLAPYAAVGVAGAVAVSVAGTVVAAVLGALFARAIRPSLAVPTLWVVGVGSPLLFDSQILMAHSVGAALAAGATLLALRATEHRRLALAIGAATCVLAATLLRNEAVLYGLALGATLAVLGLRRRRRADLVTASTIALAAIIGYGLDSRLTSWALGSGATTLDPPASGGGGFLDGRVTAFATTWLRPAYGPLELSDLLLLCAAGALVGGALLLRRRPDERDVVVVVAVFVVAAAGARVLLAPPATVPGLLVAFPVLVAGLVLVRGPMLRVPAVVLALGTSGLFTIAVLATQYDSGGGGEWGGRYFALALPVATPVALEGLRRAGEALDRRTRRVALAALVAVTLALSTIAVTDLRRLHDATDDIVTDVVLRNDAVPAGDGGDPVLVTDMAWLPRAAWSELDRRRWLRAETDRVPVLLDRLAGTDVDRLTLVTFRDQPDLDVVPGWEPAGEPALVDRTRWRVVELLRADT